MSILPLLIAAAFAFSSPVSADEQVVLFPTAAHFDAAQQAWVGEIHGWIYELEADSAWRGEVVEALKDAAELDRIEWPEDLLKSRALPFLADNEGGKQIDVRIAGLVVQCEKSHADGHFRGAFVIPHDNIPPETKSLEAEVNFAQFDFRKFSTEVYCLSPKGVSIVSDIDDTIKQSNVLDKVELLRNTFARPFAPVAGMSDVYRQLAERGASFHYVSASPWQLYAPLEQFGRLEKFPPGTWDMKSFRIWDASWKNLLANSSEVKTPAIERLLHDSPQRRFVLIGDSGEADPEIYGAIARAHPDQILGIAIRSVRDGESLEDEQFEAAFRDIAREKVRLFETPIELQAGIDSWWPL